MHDDDVLEDAEHEDLHDPRGEVTEGCDHISVRDNCGLFGYFETHSYL